jgi:hypothetical protein
LTTALVTVSATSTLRNAPIRFSSTGRDRGGHRVAGVVEPVREIEPEGDHDDQGQEDEFRRHRRSVVVARLGR